MPKQKANAKFIIKQSLKVFRNKGYHSTSMADIAKACGLLKGSLYHYFKSKEALMSAVIEHLHSFYNREVFSQAYNKELGAKQKLQLLIDISERQFFSAESGCLMGNLALETVSTVPEFSEKVKKFFQDWMDAMTHIFLEKYPLAQAQQLGKECVAEVEGAIMMMRLFDDRQFLIRAHQIILQKFEQTPLPQSNKI